MMQRLLVATTETLNDDEVAVIAITSGVKRDGDEWLPSGVDLTNFNRNPIVLDSHDPRKPIGVAALALANNRIEGKIKFAPLGLSADADRVRGLAKAGVLVGVSAGVDPITCKPLHPPYRGTQVVACELLEVSLCAVQADPDSRIIARSFAGYASREQLLRRLPVVSPVAMERLRAILSETPQQRRLAQAAAACGETLTPARIATIVSEAQRIGRDPVFHYQWMRANRGISNSDSYERQARLCTAAALAKSP